MREMLAAFETIFADHKRAGNPTAGGSESSELCLNSVGELRV
jgi:hypothetical protein